MFEVTAELHESSTFNWDQSALCSLRNQQTRGRRQARYDLTRFSGCSGCRDIEGGDLLCLLKLADNPKGASVSGEPHHLSGPTAILFQEMFHSVMFPDVSILPRPAGNPVNHKAPSAPTIISSGAGTNPRELLIAYSVICPEVVILATCHRSSRLTKAHRPARRQYPKGQSLKLATGTR